MRISYEINSLYIKQNINYKYMFDMNLIFFKYNKYVLDTNTDKDESYGKQGSQLSSNVHVNLT